jgi:predicted CXXCH cytochrome family protein
MGRSLVKPFILIALPTVCVFFALDTSSQSPGTTAHSTYEQHGGVRNPATISAEIKDPVEQQAFRSLSSATDPAERLRLAEAFLSTYPQSWVLAQVYAIAANAAMETGNYDRALEYASASLQILPEDPLLLVSVAGLQAQRRMFDAAEQNSREALDELDRFLPPASIPEEKWPQLKQQLRASCYFALGRAEVSQALTTATPAARDKLLREALDDLARARGCNGSDAEIPYLAGLACLSRNDAESAASQFAAAYRLGGPLEAKSLQQLQKLYGASPAAQSLSFAAYLKSLPDPAVQAPMPGPVVSTAPLPAYAGSNACRQCHPDVYEHWSHTGMAKMLRPYRPENVIGDFTNHNKFYDDSPAPGKDGETKPATENEQRLFALMIIDQGRHYFEIRQSGGWRRYPVDYTIGSKWEQAYATRLSNGEIHVFPVQYNRVEKRWLNFWKTLDAPGSPRTDLGQWEKLDVYTSYQANCAVCHTSQLRNVKDEGFEPNNLTFREPGIDCEMCHGPAAQHVASIQAGKPYEKRPIDPPVDFSRISAAEFMAICAQCHEQSAVRHELTELNYSTTGQFFQHYRQRPFIEFSRKGFYKDGRLRGTAFIVESLMRSKCFKKGNVTCGSCHDPHSADADSNPTSLKFRDHPDQMCLQCHAPFATKEAMERHTHHPAASEGSRCVSCHMPRIMDALLFKARTHQISEIPNADFTQRFGQDESPNACLLCHKNQSASWVKTQLVSWNREAGKSSGR